MAVAVCSGWPLFKLNRHRNVGGTDLARAGEGGRARIASRLVCVSREIRLPIACCQEGLREGDPDTLHLDSVIGASSKIAVDVRVAGMS